MATCRASRYCCDAPNIQEDDCGTQDVLVCRSCGQTLPRDQTLDYSEVQQVGEQVSDTYKRPIKQARLLYRKKCRKMCKKACQELTLSSEYQKCTRIVEEAVKSMQGISLRACVYGVAYLLGRKLRYSLTIKQVARISEIDYDKVGQAVLRLKAIFKDLQDEDEDETTVFEQRAEKLLEQLEIGKTDEERVLIVKTCSKVFQIMIMLRKYITMSGGNNFTLGVTIIGIESFTKKHIPSYQMRRYCFKTHGLHSNEISCLVFDMKKELYEIAKCIPWIKQKIDDKRKEAYRTKIWTMYKYVDTIYNYRQLYIVKEKIDLEYSYPHCLFTTSLEECRRRQGILERLQKEMNCEPPPFDQSNAYLWPYCTNRKQREKLSKMHQQRSCEDEEEAIIGQITQDCVEEQVTNEDDDIMCEELWCCDTAQDISQDTAYLDQNVIENSQYSIHSSSSCDLQDTDDTQDTSQDIIENTQYSIHKTSSCDLQDTGEKLSDDEVEQYIRQLLQKGVSTERILTGDLKDMLAGQFIHFLPPCLPSDKDGGSIELTEEDMSDEELMSYIKTEEEIVASCDPPDDDQGAST